MIVLLLALILVVLLCGSSTGRSIVAAIIGTVALLAVVMVVISLYVDWRTPQPTYGEIVDKIIAHATADRIKAEQQLREANRLKIAKLRQVYEQAAGRDDLDPADVFGLRVQIEECVRLELARQREFDESLNPTREPAKPAQVTMDEIFGKPGN